MLYPKMSHPEAEDVFDPVNPLISTGDCALLCALPLSLKEFEGDIADKNAGLHRGDYATQIIRSDTRSDLEQHWLRSGSRTAELVRDVLRAAKETNFSPNLIVENTDLDAVKRVVRLGARAILLVAHWRNFELHEDDLTPEAHRKLARYADTYYGQGGCELSSFLRHIELKAGTPKRNLAQLLTANYLTPSEPELRRMKRKQLEGICGSDVFPGYAIELRDGMWSAQAFSNALGDHWSGIVDLYVCHSFELADAIRAGRDDRLVITNEETRYPERCLRELKMLLWCLSGSRVDFRETRSEIFKMFSKITLESR